MVEIFCTNDNSYVPLCVLRGYLLDLRLFFLTGDLRLLKGNLNWNCKLKNLLYALSLSAAMLALCVSDIKC